MPTYEYRCVSCEHQFERFQREKQVMSTLKHPAILPGLDSGVYNRTPYLVTELVDEAPTCDHDRGPCLRRQ